MTKSYKIYPNVKIGPNAYIGEFVLIGVPPRGKSEGELETVIGANAIIRSHTVIYAGNRIGDNFQTGNGAKIREENEIGDNVSVGMNSIVEHHVKIANKVRIHSQVFIPEYTILEEECWLGPHAVITNAKYPKSINAKKELKGAYIKKHAIIGANSTLLPGIIIGEGALVGAGSVVTKDVPDNAVVVGNPARVLRTVKNYVDKYTRM